METLIGIVHPVEAVEGTMASLTTNLAGSPWRLTGWEVSVAGLVALALKLQIGICYWRKLSCLAISSRAGGSSVLSYSRREPRE